MTNTEIDVNQVIDDLSKQCAELLKTIAIQRSQIMILQKRVKGAEGGDAPASSE